MIDGKVCYYCSACWNVCPVGAIIKIRDDGRFNRVYVDDEICIKCRKCDDVCPVNIHCLKKPIEYYAAYHAQKRRNIESASGGVASALAEQILAKGGAVCGCVWDENFREAKHTIIYELDSLKRLNGVKYVQSEKGSCYLNIKKLLDQGKQLLFVGVPCEVAGLMSFLGRNYDNLVTIDLICQGTTTNEVTRQYFDYISRGKRIVSVDLRYQDFFHRDPEFFLLNIQFEDGFIMDSFFESEYGYAFSNYKRSECYECQFKGGSMADLTIGDCWGIDKNYPFYSEYGTSMVIVNSEKGKNAILHAKDLNIWEVGFELLSSNKRFFDPIEKDDDYEKFKRCFVENGLIIAVKNARPFTIKHAISKRIPWIIKKHVLKKGKPVMPFNPSRDYQKVR